MPFVEATTASKADRERRAIAGLSMGGGQSLTVGLGTSTLRLGGRVQLGDRRPG